MKKPFHRFRSELQKKYLFYIGSIHCENPKEKIVQLMRENVRNNSCSGSGNRAKRRAGLFEETEEMRREKERLIDWKEMNRFEYEAKWGTEDY